MHGPNRRSNALTSRTEKEKLEKKINYSVFSSCGWVVRDFFKGKQKLGVTFNSHKLGGIDFTKFSKLTMLQCLGGSPGHHFSKKFVCKV